MDKAPKVFNAPTQQSIKNSPEKSHELINQIDVIEGVLGKLKARTEAANNDEFIQSLESRTDLSAIKDQVAREWLKNVHLYTDYRRLLKLYKDGYLKFSESGPKFNIEKVKGKKWRDLIPTVARDDNTRNVNSLYECLKRSSVADLPDLETFRASNERERKDKGIRFMREKICLPDSLDMLTSGESGRTSYGEEKTNQNWYNDITLPDGTVTNAFEIKLAQKMNHLGVKRTPSGLVFTKGDMSGQRATLSKIIGSVLSGGLPQNKSSFEVYQNSIPNLRKMRLIQDSDFSVKERGDGLNNIRLKKKTTADVSLRSPIGSSKYYFGRDRYIQNKKSIPEQTFTATLDELTAGVFEEQNGVRKLMYIFPLITAEEYKQEKERIAQKLAKSVGELTETEITQNMRKKLTPNEIKEYSATDYMSQYAGESTKEYAKRVVETMSNGEATANAINEIFMGADIDHLPLSWGKKIRLAEATREIDKNKIIGFVKKFGIAGLQVMLASEVDKNWPEEVLSYADKPSAKDLFEAYAPMLTDEDEFKNVINTSVTESVEAHEHLADLRRASLEDVITSIRKVMSGEVPLADVVSTSRGGVIAKLSLVKALKKEGLLDSVEEIRGASLDAYNPRDISDDDKKILREMYALDHVDNELVQAELLKSFDESMADTSDKVRFFIFRDNGTIKGSYRVKESGHGHYEIASFTVAPNYRGYKLGETMFEQTIDLLAKNETVSADCDSKVPISAKYIETGWVATRYWDDHGDKILDIVRNDRKRERYVAKKFSHEEIISGNIGEGMIVKTAREQKDLPFELCNDGYVLTRMFLDPKTGQHYAVFEPAPPAHTEPETSVDASHR